MSRALSALGCGAWLKNRACLLEGDRVLWSPQHGDLGDPANCSALAHSVDDLLARASCVPAVVAHDLHPDFYSTWLAVEVAGRLGVPAIGIQHHLAHIGVALAEQGIAEPVIGIALDGVGLGTDNRPWGGEMLWLDGGRDAARWERLAHLPPLSLPGGDVAAREPWRLAAAVLFALGRGGEIESRFGPAAGANAVRGVRTMLEKDLRCPESTSAGRWFDAAAGALGLCLRQSAEAEAALLLEQRAASWLADHPAFDLDWTSLDLYSLLERLFALAGQGEDAQGQGAAIFHLGLVGGLAQRAIELAAAREVGTVVLAGGCFFNSILNQSLTRHLQQAGLRVVQPQAAGCGDAGLALGQAWLASLSLPH